MTTVADAFARSAADDYWIEARRPLACLCFLAPLLAAYETGVIWLAGDGGRLNGARNGADDWIRSALEQFGWAYGFLLPALVITCLVGWHVWGRFPWRVDPETLAGMLAESLLFATGLVVAGQLLDLAFHRWQGRAMFIGAGPEAAARSITYLGAGIYEEVLFRLLLLPAVRGLARASGFGPRAAAAVAVIATSVLFSWAHHVGPGGETWDDQAFAFRLLAGLVFGTLFLTRGFGITVGCHAGYDLLVGVLFAPPA